MTQKSAKKKGKKSTKASAQPGVLGSLRSTRPERIGADRRASARRRTSATTALADEAARAKPAATSAKASKAGPTKAEAAAAKTAKAKPAATAARSSAAKPAKAKPAAKAAKAKPAKPEAARAKPKAAKVKPVKRVVPKPAATSRPQPPLESDGRAGGPPRGAEIVTTAVQAAGELAQIGVTVGGQLLRRAARRIPRP